MRDGGGWAGYRVASARGHIDERRPRSSISGDPTPFWPGVVPVGSDATLRHRLEGTPTATVERLVVGQAALIPAAA